MSPSELLWQMPRPELDDLSAWRINQPEVGDLSAFQNTLAPLTRIYLENGVISKALTLHAKTLSLSTTMTVARRSPATNLQDHLIQIPPHSSAK